MEANRDAINDESVLVVIMPDGGYRALGKVYNDVWMQEHGFLDEAETLTAGALARRRSTGKALVSAPADMSLDDAIAAMRERGISQVPVMEGEEVIGSLTELDILRSLMGDPDARGRLVRDLMGPPFPVVEASSPIHGFARQLRGEQPAVLVREEDGTFGILTRSDLIAALGA